MAKSKKLTLLKLPKRPKLGASNEVLERYIKRADQIKKENAHRTSAHAAALKKREALKKKIQNLKK
jgi:hypothetical protein